MVKVKDKRDTRRRRYRMVSFEQPSYLNYSYCTRCQKRKPIDDIRCECGSLLRHHPRRKSH